MIHRNSNYFTMKTLYTNLAKELIGEKVKISMTDNHWWFDGDFLTIYAGMYLINNREEKAFMGYMKKNKIIGLTSFILSFVHELGHFVNFDEIEGFWFNQEELDKIEIANKRKKFRVAFKLYYNTEPEKVANEFLFKMYKEKFDILKKYDDKIRLLYKIKE